MQVRLDDDKHYTTQIHFDRITVYTLLCFALAGLMLGFAAGGFLNYTISHAKVDTHEVHASRPSIAKHASSQATSTVEENIQPGNPIIGTGDYAPGEQADGITTYKFSTQIIDKNTNTPIQTDDVTCRLWLTRDATATQTALRANNYALPKNPGSFRQPFPAEEEGALNFAKTSPQVQPCAPSGSTSWNYTLSPTSMHGTWYLAVMADWQGRHYNWYLVSITVNPENNTGN